MKTTFAFLVCLICSRAAAAAAEGPGKARASVDPDWMPRFVTQGSSQIACPSTPFGRYATLGEDAEYVSFASNGGSLNRVDVFAPGPADGPALVSEFGADLLQSGGLAGSTFLTATAADLNGDGRDEMVTVHRVNSGGTLRLGVFRRAAAGSLSLVQTWNLSRSFSHVELAAGDLDGSTEGKQELALMLQGTGTNALEVYVLTGNAQGQIAQASGAWAGRWVLPGGFPLSSLAVGDLLLTGREQMLVANESGSGGSRALNYHLLEFQPTTAALPVGTGNTAIGSRSFSTLLGTSFDVDGAGGVDINQLRRLEALVGDVVDSAAAELMVLVLVEGSSNFNQLFARMHHFVTERDVDNNIVGIDLFRRSVDRPWDSSFAVSGQSQGALIQFDAAFANVDLISPSEFVMAFAEENDNLLRVQAHRASAELTAGFQWQRSGRTVTFTDRSTGRVASRSWNFGDGSGPLTDLNPVYTFPAGQNQYTVTLTVRGVNNQTVTRQHIVRLGPSDPLSGGAGPDTRYVLNTTPAYSASLTVDTSSDLRQLDMAVGDMDKNGVAEVMTFVNDRDQQLIRSVWRLQNTANPASFSGRHLFSPTSGLGNSTRLLVVAADTDGDSVRATLGTDCRQLEEPQVRQLVWHPPYFERLQADADKLAAFGQTTSGQSSTEKRAGSFTSHDVSAYVGVSAGFDVLGVGVETSIKATAGYNYQSNYGSIHGSENAFALNQGFSSSLGEALMVVEENTFRCYTYDIRREANGIVPNSGLRMCEVVEDTRGVSATTAQFWDTVVAAGNGTGAPPAQWAPLHRDWASLSLFQDASINFAPASGVAANATDGYFTTALTSPGNATRPYVQIDLGEVQDISNIRIFPRSGQAARLRGFRVFVSENPMSGDAIPGGADVQIFAPETGDDMPFDRWNIHTRSAGGQMLRGRYVRLQHPGTATLDISQIQVFGDVHVEPHRYPQMACDPNSGDNWFLVRMWNPRTSGWTNIQVRGQILWNGTGDMPGIVGVDGSGCSNYSEMQQWNIWSDLFVGSPGSTSWNLSQEGGVFAGDFSGFESSNRVGAEFDIEAGFVANVQAGAAYEYSFGVTEEVQTVQYWGEGLDMGGEIGGFAPEFSSLVSTCRYTPRPYAYRLLDYSNTGYEHTMFVVDYVVRQGASSWQRDNVPEACLNIQRPPEVFANGFE